MNGTQGNQPSQSARNANQRIGTKKKLTQKRLKSLLDYDPETGIFTWRISRGHMAKGAAAGSINSDGYIQISIDYNMHKAHRLVFIYVDGYSPENEVDHINRNKIDNRRINLREVSRVCNCRNASVKITNKSGVSGVFWSSSNKKWGAAIRHGGKQIHLGTFDEKIKAAKARWDAEVKYDFPNCNTTSSAYNFLIEKRPDLLAGI